LLIAILSGAVGLIFVLVKLLGRQFQSETQIIRHKVDDLSKDFYSFKEKIAIDKLFVVKENEQRYKPDGTPVSTASGSHIYG